MFARDYFQVAKSAMKLDTGKRINYPAYFLYTRALELLLKSVLLASGTVTKENLKVKCKHDFDKILKLFTSDLKENICLEKSDEDVLLTLNKWYKTSEKKFEYYDLMTSGIISIEKTNYPILPDFNVLQSLGEKMINEKAKGYILSKS
jgi:hypothetical protein